RIDLGALADYWIDRVERLLRACVRDRERLPATQSLDVPFHAFMRDEAGTIARIYDRARLPLDDTARTRLDATLATHRPGRPGAARLRPCRRPRPRPARRPLPVRFLLRPLPRRGGGLIIIPRSLLALAALLLAAPAPATEEAFVVKTNPFVIGQAMDWLDARHV